MKKVSKHKVMIYYRNDKPPTLKCLCLEVEKYLFSYRTVLYNHSIKEEVSQ